jgi:hypothetical protein
VKTAVIAGRVSPPWEFPLQGRKISGNPVQHPKFAAVPDSTTRLFLLAGPLQIPRAMIETPSQPEIVPSHSTLQEFALEPGCVDGVGVDSLPTGTVLVVQTLHTRYRVIVLDGEQQRALVTGGSMFPVSTEVRIEGSTTGGNVMKVAWIGIGLRLEMTVDSRRVITSRICSVTIVSVPPREREFPVF